MRYWSALALLRCVSSSPAAAAATLRSRAAVDEAADIEIDEVGRRTVLDQDDTDDVAVIVFSPGSDDETSATNTRRKLLEFAVAQIHSDGSRQKTSGAIKEIKELRKNSLTVFYRFVDTGLYCQSLRELWAKRFVSNP